MNSVIDHFNVPVLDLQRSLEFYVPVLSVLDLTVLHRQDDAVGFGVESWDIGLVEESAVVPVHFAMIASSTELVKKFHTTALASGGIDNGAPGYRVDYGKSYYAAYVYDRDGHNVEVVCRG